MFPGIEENMIGVLLHSKYEVALGHLCEVMTFALSLAFHKMHDQLLGSDSLVAAQCKDHFREIFLFFSHCVYKRAFTG